MKNKNTVFVVTAVDYGETVDGKASVLGIFNTKDEAKRFVHNDITTWTEHNKDEDLNVDYDKMSAYFDFDTDGGCEWNIEEVNMP